MSAINFTNVQTKLDTINAKNKQQILTDKIYFPNIRIPKNFTAITNSLATASNALIAVKSMTSDAQVTTAQTTVQNGLCATCKANLPKIIDHEAQPCTADYDKFRMIRLYIFAVK